MIDIYIMHWIDIASTSKTNRWMNQQKHGEEVMFLKTIGNLGLVTLIATSFGASIARAESTENTWKHHIQAWEARSVSAIVSDYSDESVLVLNNQIFKGREEITTVFTQLFRIFDNGSNRIDTPLLFDRFVYITWHFSPTNKPEFFGTDTFVIEDGKIILQTIASPLYELYPIHPLTK